MNKSALLLLALHCPLLFAQEFKILTLMEMMDVNGFEETRLYAKENTYFQDGKLVMDLSDKLGEIGSDELVRTQWEFSSLSASKFKLSTPIGQHYILEKDVFSDYDLTTCEDSGASGGVKYITFKNGVTLFYEYSYGSAGGSFQIVFDSEHYDSIEDKCHSGWTNQ